MRRLRAVLFSSHLSVHIHIQIALDLDRSHIDLTHLCEWRLILCAGHVLVTDCVSVSATWRTCLVRVYSHIWLFHVLFSYLLLYSYIAVAKLKS